MLDLPLPRCAAGRSFLYRSRVSKISMARSSLPEMMIGERHTYDVNTVIVISMVPFFFSPLLS